MNIPNQLQYNPPISDDGSGNSVVGIRWMVAFLAMLQKNWGLLAQILNGLLTQINTPQTWQGVSLLNSWVTYGVSEAIPGYYSDQLGRVWLRGFLKGGTSGSVVFVLPVGYRPTYLLVFSAISEAGAGFLSGEVDVLPNGNVVAYFPATGTTISLDGISFDTRA